MNLNFTNETVLQLVVTIFVVLAAGVINRIARRVIRRYIDEPERRYKASKFTGRTLATVTSLVVVVLWSPQLGGLATFLTVIGAGLAIALREVLMSLVGWALIVFRKLYEHGDRIEIDGLRGDVLDVRLQYTTLMEVGGWVQADQSTGRIVHVPNNLVLQKPIYNDTFGFNFIWHELPVTLTFRSDWEAAREIMLELAEQTSAIVEQQARSELQDLSNAYLIHYSLMTPFVYVNFAENGIRLTLRYLTAVRKRRGVEHALTLRILQEFKAHGGIEFAYPTMGVARPEDRQFG